MAARFVLHASQLADFGTREALDWLSKRYSIELIEGPYTSLIAYLERAERHPEAIVIAVSGEADTVLTSLDGIANYIASSTDVYAAGRLNDIDFYRRLLALGLTDYLLLPSAPETLDILFQTLQAKHGKARGRVIGCIGIAGGVGTSTFAINFASHLSKFNRHPIFLIDGGPALLSWANSLALEHEKITVTQLSNADEPRMRDHFKAISIHSSLHFVLPKADSNQNIGEADRIRLLADFIRSHVETGDSLVLDLGLNNTSNELLSLCDHIVLIGEPDFRSLQRVLHFRSYYEAICPYARLHLVLNKIELRDRIEFGPKDFSRQFGAPPHLAFVTPLK